MNPTDDLNQLGYVSSSPDLDLAPKETVKPQDEADLPTLVRVNKVLDDRKAYYKTTDALTFGEDITIENQLIINKKMQLHIQELQSMINATVLKVREKMNERR